MNRPVLATALALSAALATAGCSGGQAATRAAASTPSTQAGSQSYASMLDLYSAVLGTGTQCSDVTIEPAATAKSEASCDLGSGRSLILQTWRDRGSRDAGVSAAEAALPGRHVPYCVLAGVGATGLWSVQASGDSRVCADIAHRLGGHVTSSAGTR